MDKDSKLFFIIGLVIAVIIVGGIIFYAKKGPSGPGQLDAFAACLKDRGAVFYGAFWCPHCIATKKLFGNSSKLLPYVECSTPDGQGQLQICIDNKIESYPTWTFEDGSRLYGELTLEQLSGKTGCPVNGTVATTTSTTTFTTPTSGMPTSTVK